MELERKVLMSSRLLLIALATVALTMLPAVLAHANNVTVPQSSVILTDQPHTMAVPARWHGGFYYRGDPDDYYFYPRYYVPYGYDVRPFYFHHRHHRWDRDRY